MPRLQTQLTGWESSCFRYSHVFKYSSACSPLSAPCGISSIVLQGRGPVETWETLRGWVKKKKKNVFPLLTGCFSLHHTAPSNRRTQTHSQQVSDERNGLLLWKRTLKWLIPWLPFASLKPDSLNSWIHVCSAEQHCWWAQTVMWHLNILIKNACSEGKQRGAPARED